MESGETNTEVQVEAAPPVEDIDALYDSIMGPSVETDEPTEGKIVEPNADDKVDVKSDAKITDDLMTLKHKDFENGEKQFPREKVTEYAQKGFDYELKMHDLKSERKIFEELKSELDSEQKSFTEEKEYWSGIDNYMKDNPGFQQIVKNEWAKVQNNPSLATSPEVSELQNTVKQLQDRLDGKDSESMETRTREVERNFVKSTADYKEKNSDFDWSTADEFGNTLQDRIESHAVENGFKDFTKAANDLLHEQHILRAKLKGKEEAAKELLEKRKNGLGPITDRSVRQTSEAKNVNKMSYQDLANEALQEYGLG